MQTLRASRLSTGLFLGLVAATSLAFGACEQVETKAAPAPVLSEETSAPTPAGDTGIAPLSASARSEYEQNSIDVFKKVAPSVVFVTNKQLRRDVWTSRTMEVKAGQGTGFVWDKEGHIVTNAHVVDGGSTFEVSLYGGKTYDARLIGADPSKDLAVLKIVPPRNLVPVHLPPETNKVEVGQKAVAIGNPFGFDHTLTVGVISATGRQMMGFGGVPIHDMLQTDASINPGNSGGPLIDSQGRLIGVNTMISSKSGSSAGVGFAVPVAAVRKTVPFIIEHGNRRRAGMGISAVADQIAQSNGIRGVVIDKVTRGSAAARAGLKGIRYRNDGAYLGDVIVGIDQHRIDDFEDLTEALRKHKPGDVVTVTILRNEERKQVKLKLMALR